MWWKTIANEIADEGTPEVGRGSMNRANVCHANECHGGCE